MNYKIFLIVILFLHHTSAYSAVDPTKLIKVDRDNNSKCVEYYLYKDTIYCSDVNLSQSTPDANIIKLEVQKIKFDERPWQAVWGKNTPEITTVEYVPAGDNIDQWQELITSQVMPNVQQLTVKDYVNSVIKNLQDSGFKPVINIIEEKPNQILFEFRIKEPPNQQQDELQIITKKNNAFYIIHYVIKKSDMGEVNRKKWILNLKQSEGNR